MKIKGINPIEKHVEKIVLLVVGVVFLGVVAMQFLVSPNQIEVGQGRTANPDEIYGVLQERANKLKALIEESNPTLPEVQRADLLEAYESGMEGTPSVAPALAAWLERPSGFDDLGADAVDQLIATGDVRPMEVPAPVSPVAFAQWNTLDPFSADRWGWLASGTPVGAPADFVGVSIEGAFPGAELMASLTEVSEGERPIPRKLWQRGGLAVLDVEVERQRRTADGGWSDPERVFTAGPDALAELSPDPDAEVLMSLVREVADDPGLILNPGYPPTISGAPWAPPTEALARAERWANEAEAERLRTRIAQIEEDMRSGNTPRTNRRPATSGSRDPSTGRPGTNTRPNQNRPRDDDNSREQRQIEQLEERLRELGFDPDEDDRRRPTTRTRSTDPNYADPGSRDRAGAGRTGTPSLLEAESIPVWAHDLTAEPGAAYRYRMRVVLNNPLYQRNALLDPDDPGQQALAADAVARGAWSEWTDPISVPDRSYLFVSGVSAGPGLNEAASDRSSVSGEVYTMYYGYYRKSPFSIELGDAVRASTDLPDTLVLFDTAAVAETEAERLLEDILRRAEDDQARASDTRAGTPNPAPIEYPQGATPAPANLPLAYDAALVDVTESLVEVEEGGLGGGDRPVVEVVFRAADGSLMVRSVGENSGPVYTLVSASARRGEREALTRIVPEQDAGRPAWANQIPAPPPPGAGGAPNDPDAGP